MKRLFVVFIASLAFTAGPVFALDFCADTIVDESIILDTPAYRSLQTTAELVAQDTDVRTYIVANSQGFGSPEMLMEHLVRNCDSLRDPSGMKKNLIVLMVTLQPRSVSLFYGSDSAVKLKPVHAGFIKDFTQVRLGPDNDHAAIAESLIVALNDIHQYLYHWDAERGVPTGIPRSDLELIPAENDRSRERTILIILIFCAACLLAYLQKKKPLTNK